MVLKTPLTGLEPVTRELTALHSYHAELQRQTP